MCNAWTSLSFYNSFFFPLTFWIRGRKMSYLLTTLTKKKEIDTIIRDTIDKVLVLRFGRATDALCLQLDDIVLSLPLFYLCLFSPFFFFFGFPNGIVYSITNKIIITYSLQNHHVMFQSLPMWHSWTLTPRMFRFTSSTSILLWFHQLFSSSMLIIWRWILGGSLCFLLSHSLCFNLHVKGTIFFRQLQITALNLSM